MSQRQFSRPSSPCPLYDNGGPTGFSRNKAPPRMPIYIPFNERTVPELSQGKKLGRKVGSKPE